MCVALEEKNALLRGQLDLLEGKVKVLQVAMGAAPAPAQPVRAKRKKVEPPPPEPGTSWPMVLGAGTGILALIAGLVLFLRRKKSVKPVAPPKVGLGMRLKARLGRKPAPGKPVEPTLDEAAHDLSTQL
jgi:LPXTG-motif cell wall-anchored protein